MKNSATFISAVIILIFIIFACAKKEKLSPNGWFEEDKKEFMTDCQKQDNNPGIPKEKVKIYCECMMEKIMKKYPKYSDTYGKQKSEFKEMMKECDEKARIENNE